MGCVTECYSRYQFDELAYKYFLYVNWLVFIIINSVSECFIFPRLKRIINIGGLSRVRGLACLKESGRLAVAHRDGLSVIDIRDE